jgi:cytochrome c peroxidase
MTCHSQLWIQAPLLEPIHRSLASDMPVKWTRVNDLPDFVYFDHSIHVNKGIGCASCHGPIDQMPLTWRENTLYMRWCLECHRAPEKQIRPRDQVFNMHWGQPADQVALGRDLVAKYHVQTARLTSCSVCHH